MDRLALKYTDAAGENCSCPVCGIEHVGVAGPRLYLPEQAEPVCRTCARKLAPNLAALVDLAQAADKVGRTCRHLLTPPMESLLALARAAENYSSNAPARVAA